ncbi:MAG: DUF192 domain-containing protein [Candidatus Brocadiales bacterium]
MTNSLGKGIFLAILTVFLATLIWVIAPCNQAASKNLTKIVVGNKEVFVELAVTAKERGRGLQFRTSLPEDHGMLFIFPTEKLPSFWMEDTYIPLSVAFIKKSGLITQIEEMEPGSHDRHTSRENTKYALEMNAGWFKRNNIHVGDMVTIPLIADTTHDKVKQAH